MSKMDALRAMREARYAQSATPTARPAARPSPAVAPPVAPATAAGPAASTTAPAPADADADTEALCGHRNMGGRTCTREQGHSAKSHRYS